MKPHSMLGALMLAGCSAASPGTSSSDTAAARATVVRLEAEARAVAKSEGCSSVQQCRQAPVGDRPCGGPRTYIAYCAATTDSAALFRKLDEVKAADQEVNRLTNAISTCEFRTPPVPSLSGGRCGP